MLVDKQHLLRFLSFGLILGLLAWGIIYASFCGHLLPDPMPFEMLGITSWGALLTDRLTTDCA